MSKNNSAAIKLNEEKQENDIVEEYHELNKKCDILINKIKIRKQKKKNG